MIPDGSQSQQEALGSTASETLFKELVKTHHKRLHRFILSKIGNGSDSEDLTQQAFLEAAIAYERFRGESELSTWLYGIAMNLVRNYLSRSPHRRHDFVSDEGLASLDDGQPGPAGQFEQSELIKALDREINELPAEMREVLMMVGLEEMSYEEAAVLLSIPIGTVRSRLSRARSQLRACLSDS